MYEAKAKKAEPMEACPACSCTKGYRVDGNIKLHSCERCEGLVGTLYLGESYRYVLPYFVEQEPPAEQTRYFDFTTLGSKGVGRRHGWFEPATKRIVQVG